MFTILAIVAALAIAAVAVIGPAIDAFIPDWLFISAGYDGHRSDPITDLGYTSADVADMVAFLISDAGRNLSGQSLPVDGNVEAL